MKNETEKEKISLVYFYGDGLWDIFLGSIFIAGGLQSLSGSLLPILFALAGLLALIIGRRTITQPRAAEIDPPSQKRSASSVLLLLLLLALLLILALWYFPASGILSQTAAVGLVAALIVPLVLLYLANMLNFKRLYGYAFLVALFMLAGQWISPQAGAWLQLLSGLIILTIGFWQLNKFMKRDVP